jgi:hypothetical protein
MSAGHTLVVTVATSGQFAVTVVGPGVLGAPGTADLQEANQSMLMLIYPTIPDSIIT